ncbi:winged helix-turn-helix domain-containing protein [Granulosicoccaceae sp. 1_MG-2023]|nr:winged helix-turn-helix domain-containing protein [Granulosicoccaceae sp. 1_MG-2023]
MTISMSVNERRLAARAARQSASPARAGLLGPALAESWDRSEQHLPHNREAAPAVSEAEIRSGWDASPINLYCKRELELFSSTAANADMLAVVADNQGRLLWMQGPRPLRRWAEKVNFAPAGCWGEQAMGTNALSVALESGRPGDVVGEEHFVHCLGDWVCYAAPVIDPRNGRRLGVIDMSAPVRRHNALAGGFVTSIARSISEQLARVPGEKRLTLNLMGTPDVFYNGQALRLTRRQLEILTLLALHRMGMSAEQLLQALYGDKNRSQSTLKAEISHLRKMLGGAIDSRPYRLTLPVEADFLQIWQLLEGGKYTAALQQIRGSFFSATDCPALTHWRYCLDAAISRAISSCEDQDVIVRFAAANPDNDEAIARLSAICR